MAGELSERQRVRELIQRAGVAMLTTIDDHGVLAGRPMLPLLLDNDPDVYFLTHQGSRKVTQISTKAHVALTIMSADRYFAVAGVAYASRDPDLIRRLWHPTYRAWFPEGREAGDATVLQIGRAHV